MIEFRKGGRNMKKDKSEKVDLIRLTETVIFYRLWDILMKNFLQKIKRRQNKKWRLYCSTFESCYFKLNRTKKYLICWTIHFFDKSFEHLIIYKISQFYSIWLFICIIYTGFFISKIFSACFSQKKWGIRQVNDRNWKRQ